MKLFLLAICLVAVAQAVPTTPTESTPAPTPPPKTVEERMRDMETLIEGLSRQVMLQQFYVEERVRTDGSSGLKQTRVARDGTKNYYIPAHTDYRFMAIHDHANYDRTVGLGELNMVMNGVEFRTRHNDYKLVMPSTDTTKFHKTVKIPFPDVPPSVLNQTTVQDQIVEMREYFKAFKNQDPKHRDYRPFFKPNLCYIEGAWVTSTDKIVEGFESDRHAIDASSWFDLMNKAQFTSYTGSKSVLENFAFLPTTIAGVDNGAPHYAQWNYRIVCHPLKDDLSTKKFLLEEDLLFRFPARKTFYEVKEKRAARYRLSDKGWDHFGKGNSLLDNLMMQIPGKNNYPAVLHDTSMDMVMEDVRYNNHTLINTGYYHRYFKTSKKGAMGTNGIHRGFSDGHLFVAQTTHPQVMPKSVEGCQKKDGENECKSWTTRYSYALPLEVVYMTPLLKWNPYDVATYVDEKVLQGNSRNGDPTPEKAFNGTNFKSYYLTPSEFYTSANVESDPADTAKSGAGVLDKKGNMHLMSASGVRMMTPSIEGVGQVRLRYPIMPIHGEGSGVWKELNALKEMTMQMSKYGYLFRQKPSTVLDSANTQSQGSSSPLHYQLKTTYRNPPGEHSHDFYLTSSQLADVKGGKNVVVTTTAGQGHTHVLNLEYKNNMLHIKTCDGFTECWDGHPNDPTYVK